MLFIGTCFKSMDPAILGSIELKAVANQPSFIPIVKTPILINIGLVVKVDRILEFESLLQEK